MISGQRRGLCLCKGRLLDAILPVLLTYLLRMGPVEGVYPPLGRELGYLGTYTGELVTGQRLRIK